MSVPKLRFKEFDGDWANKKIDEIALVTSGGTPSRNISKYWNGHIPWVTTSLVDFNIINNAEEFITQDGVDNSSAKLFPKNTILMAMYGQGITRGKVAILGIDATTNQACAAIKLKDDIDTHFAFQNLMNRYEEIRDLSNEGGQKNLSAGIIKDISISYPSKPEQTRIASFLSAVDEKISQLNQKHELLSQYKQGMMQKLFSQQIRFKADNGNEFGEWTEKKLGEIFDFFRGEPFSKSNIDPESQFECIHYGELFTKYNEVIDKVYSKTNLKAKNPSNIGDILMPSSDVTPDGLAKASCLNRKGVFLGGDINILRPKYVCSPKFFSYLINFEKSKILLCVTGTTVKHVYNKDLKKLEYKIPSTKEEQTKIANFLSAIDQKIDVVAQQIEQAKQWKTGLLQQMFV